MSNPNNANQPQTSRKSEVFVWNTPAIGKYSPYYQDAQEEKSKKETNNTGYTGHSPQNKKSSSSSSKITIH